MLRSLTPQSITGGVPVVLGTEINKNWSEQAMAGWSVFSYMGRRDSIHLGGRQAQHHQGR